MLKDILDFFLLIDKHLISFISHYGSWTYVLLFLIIFCETGLIITPFLPGDSLLFVVGSLSAQQGGTLSFGYLFVFLVTASWLGNQLNYLFGHWIGPSVFSIKNSRIFKRAYLSAAQDFYQKHGKLTIVLARFMPIIRNFAPFIAGVAKMNRGVFMFYNFLSALLWIGSLLLAGYWLGQLPFVKAHLNLMIYTIVLVSMTPGIVTFIKQKGMDVK